MKTDGKAEFEQQVADALTPILAAFDAKSGHDHETGSSEAGWFGYSCVCEPDELARYIAPRIAAAIEAGRFNCGSDQYDHHDQEQGDTDALAALRGKP